MKNEEFPAGLSLYAEGETSINKNKQIYFLFFHYFSLLIIYIISKRNAPEPNQSSPRGDKRGAVGGLIFSCWKDWRKTLRSGSRYKSEAGSDTPKCAKRT